MIRKLSAIGVVAVALWASAVGPAISAAPRVVASILPIHSLVAGVMDGVGEPVLLVKGSGSPHTYSLRPSDAWALQNADVVFWIGNDLETFLEKPLEALAHDARIVTLEDTPGMRLLPFNQDSAGGKTAADHGRNNASDVAEHASPGREHKHARGGTDMHIWLDPGNAAAMVTQIVATLSDVDPANAPRYRANGAALQKRLAELDSALKRHLEPVKRRPYVVFHDAYRYLETRYGLRQVGAITVNPDRPPGARTLLAIRRTILETGAVCVFSEPQYDPVVVQTVVEGTNAKTAILDPLGADLEPGPDAYFTLMNSLANSLRSCLGR